jgi:hypothetical protein
MRALYDSFVKARSRRGRSAWPSTSSRRLVSTQVRALKDKGGTDVAVPRRDQRRQGRADRARLAFYG